MATADHPPYDAGSYASTYETDLGQRLWLWLNSEVNVVRLETASNLGRPAAEALDEALLVEFGEAILDDRVKQMLGHMIRQVLERRGYVIDQQNVKVTSGAPFSRATRYKRRDNTTFHVFRAGNGRQVALTARRDAGSILPPPSGGDAWWYDRSFDGELRGRVAFGVPDWKQACEDVARQGFHLYHQERLLRAAR